MIAEKVSIVGVLFLAGLYISSISSCMGGLYGSPRILQSIANENVIPVVKFLGQGRGPNKVPVYSLVVITLISLLFIFIGNVNTLGPIVTMPFMLTYAAVDYCYFALAMSFDKRKEWDARFRNFHNDTQQKTVANGSVSPAHTNYGAVKTRADSTGDLDKLFPERNQHDEERQFRSQQVTWMILLDFSRVNKLQNLQIQRSQGNLVHSILSFATDGCHCLGPW